jgi:hypothetical protein
VVTTKSGDELTFEGYDADEVKKRAERMRLKVTTVRPWTGGVTSVRLE